MANSFDLHRAYAAKQDHMLTGLGLTSAFTDHPTTKGDSTEQRWIQLFSDFLPRRYGVGNIFAIDSRGQQSQQIDLAIFDTQYAPLFFEENNVRFVPVESVYAVFEVKQSLNKAHLDYARAKVESVRQLHRTSAEIRHAGGIYPAQDPATKPILGGLLSTDSDWSDIQGVSARAAIGKPGPGGLDMGIAVRHGAFQRTPESIEFGPHGSHLIWFAMCLYKQLAAIGSALAIDLNEYSKSIDPANAD